MRIFPINYSSYKTNSVVQHNNNKNHQSQVAAKPAFGFGFDDVSFLDEPSTGFSILDLFKPKEFNPTEDDIAKVLETWDPELGDISDIVDPNRSNFGSLEEGLKELAEGKLDKPQKEEEPPSIFTNLEDL